MKKLYFLTIAMLITAGTILAMDENQENYQTPPIVAQNTGLHSSEHIAYANKITQRLGNVQTALKSNALETQFNTNINLKATHDTFYEWLALFHKSENKKVSKKFIPKIRRLFLDFKETLDNEDYSAAHNHVFKLNVAIQKMAEKYNH